MTDPNLQPMKLHARNLTARAAAVVRGNPVTTRPEDGVENCFPGLEFDQRNLDKVFLSGLSWPASAMPPDCRRCTRPR